MAHLLKLSKCVTENKVHVILALTVGNEYFFTNQNNKIKTNIF